MILLAATSWPSNFTSPPRLLRLGSLFIVSIFSNLHTYILYYNYAIHAHALFIVAIIHIPFFVYVLLGIA